MDGSAYDFAQNELRVDIVNVNGLRLFLLLRAVDFENPLNIALDAFAVRSFRFHGGFVIRNDVLDKVFSYYVLQKSSLAHFPNRKTPIQKNLHNLIL